MTLRALTAVLVLLPLACTAAAPDAEPADDHDAALQRWEAASLTDYQFDFQQECFCVREQVQPVTIEVRGGSITRVVSRETGEEVDDERLRWHTVRELFDVVTDARQQGVTPLKVEYDAELGYPTRIEAGSLAADAGVVYHASNLQPTGLSSAPTPAGCYLPRVGEEGDRVDLRSLQLEMPGVLALLSQPSPMPGYSMLGLPAASPAVYSGRAGVWNQRADTISIIYWGARNAATFRLVRDGNRLMGSVTTSAERHSSRSFTWPAAVTPWPCPSSMMVDTAAVRRHIGQQPHTMS